MCTAAYLMAFRFNIAGALHELQPQHCLGAQSELRVKSWQQRQQQQQQQPAQTNPQSSAEIVKTYFEHAFGPRHLERISESLCKPSLRTCLRVNTLHTTPQAVVQQLQGLFPRATPYQHPALSSAVIVPGQGPLQPDYDLCGGREVVVNRLAAEAVLKGAHVFSPGLLAASAGLVEGDLVAITVALEQAAGKWTGLNRGMILTPDLTASLPSRQHLAVGVGRVTSGRVGLFRQQEGLAVEMVSRVFDIPPCNGILRGDVVLQALPCIVAAQVLDPQPGSKVLDMCAAPGGKTSMLAQIMGNKGTVIALDRTSSKVQQVQELASDWGVDCISALVADATQLYQQSAQQQHKRQQLHSTVQPQQLSSSSTDEEAGGFNHNSSTGSCSKDSSDASSSHMCPASSLSASNSGSNSSSNKKKRRRSTKDSSHNSQRSMSPEVLAAVQPESFDYVLLDAPCSALGLKPRLLVDWSLPALQKLAGYQRALLHSAVHCLKPGGNLVYCTCTINPGENEENVRYALDRWPELRLVEQPVVLGGAGLVGPEWLSATEAQMVQRFDPVPGEEDTIGFFIAKFEKTKSTV